MSTAAAILAERLGLTDDELLAVLDVGPLELVGGALDHKPELPLLLALTEDVAQTGALPRWIRAKGRHGRPIELLLVRDFAAFEDAVDDLRERGFVLGG